MKKVIDLGIGYDFDAIQMEIASGMYNKDITVSHICSGIQSDYQYDDRTRESLILFLRNSERAKAWLRIMLFLTMLMMVMILESIMDIIFPV